MSKKTTYIHAENNNKILSSNEVRLYVPPEPEKMKIIIWGKELCNVAEWNDFLKCVEEKTKEIDQLKQQLAEKDKEIEMLNAIKNNAIECADLFKVALSVRQKDLAIQELEKVKNFVDGRTYCADYINKRIQDLKGE